jgi:hypothetical protein
MEVPASAESLAAPRKTLCQTAWQYGVESRGSDIGLSQPTDFGLAVSKADDGVTAARTIGRIATIATRPAGRDCWYDVV